MADATVNAPATPRAMPVGQIIGWTLLAVAVLAFPMFSTAFLLFMATLVAINVIATVGLNITVG